MLQNALFFFKNRCRYSRKRATFCRNFATILRVRRGPTIHVGAGGGHRGGSPGEAPGPQDSARCSVCESQEAVALSFLFFVSGLDLFWPYGQMHNATNPSYLQSSFHLGTFFTRCPQVHRWFDVNDLFMLAESKQTGERRHSPRVRWSS